MELVKRYTLITGASAGLGREMARIIAREHGGHLVLVARRRDRLEELANELGRPGSVDVVPLALDLTDPEQTEQCFTQATQGRDVVAAVLNAGVTYYGRATEQPRESLQALIATNVASPARLSVLFGEYFKRQSGPRHLMLVSSMLGLVPAPCQAVYGGSKAFLTSFGLALREELREYCVKVTVFCPGGIATEMMSLSGLARQFGADHPGVMDAPTCARYAVKALLEGPAIAVPGPSNRLASLATRLLPRSVVLPFMHRLYRGGLDLPQPGSD